MVTDEQVRTVALFFLFALMDEKVALDAAQKTITHLKAIRSRFDGAKPVANEELVRMLRKGYEQHSKLVPRNRPTNIPVIAWDLPPDVEIGTWLRFQKEATEVEVVAVLLSKILAFSDEEIAEGLNISLGTARYRIGKGIRNLGHAVRPTSESRKA